jgi:hypothetical protein
VVLGGDGEPAARGRPVSKAGAAATMVAFAVNVLTI